MFSPSSHDRVARCLASEALPHFPETSDDAQNGTEVHADLEAVNNGAEVERHIPDELRAILDGKHYASEVSFAYDWKTGKARELGRGLKRAERDAMLKPDEMGMTLDLFGAEEKSVVVGDFKTRYDGHVAKVERNPQLRDYALAAARAFGRSSARIFIQWVMDDGSTWADTAEMDSLDLDAHEAELRELISQRERVLAMNQLDRPPPHVGSWCKWCPAIRVCPAHVQAATALAKGQMNAVGDLAELTPEIAADAWHKLKMASRYLETIESTLKAYIRSHPIDVGDGYVLAEREVEVEKIIPDRAGDVLQAELGPLAPAVLCDSLEVKKEITWSALERALRKHVLPSRGGKITHIKDAIRESLKTGGALSVRTQKRIEEFKKPKQLEEGPAMEQAG